MTKTVYHTAHDADMAQAFARARESFPFFWRELSWESRRIVPGLDMAAIKLPFATSKGDLEHMWASDVRFDGHQLHASLINESPRVPQLKAGDAVTAPLDDLEDWMYLSRGVLCGGFSVQVMRARMGEAERRQHDQAWGLPFPEPAHCNITPCALPEAPAPKGLSRLWRKAPPPPGQDYAHALQHAQAHEHPMSENMRERFEQQLRQQPDMAHHVLDDGWTLLQYEALAGNLAPLQVLLAHGADAQRPTPQGDTPLALARRMGWARVAAALQAAG